MKNLIKFILIIIILLHFFQINAQNQPRIDSLLAKLLSAKDDTNKVKLLNDLSWEYIDLNNNTFKYSKQALQLARNLKYDKGQIISFRNIACGYRRIKRDTLNTKAYFDSAFVVCKKINDKFLLAETYWVYSHWFKKSDEINKLLQSLLTVSSNNNVKKAIAQLYLAKAFNTISMRNDDTTIYYYKKSMKTYRSISNRTFFLAAQNDFFSFLTFSFGIRDKIKETELHQQFLLEGKRIIDENPNDIKVKQVYAEICLQISDIYKETKDTVNSNKYFKTCLAILEKLKENDQKNYLTCSLLAQAYTIIGFNYSQKKDFINAEKYWKKASNNYEDVKDFLTYQGLLLNIGATYMQSYNYSNALEYYFKGLEYCEKFGNENNIYETLSLIGVIYQNTGFYEKDIEIQLKILKKSKANNNTIFTRFSSFQLARDYIKIRKSDSALYYMKICQEYSIQFEPMQPYINNFLGDIYELKEDFNKAIEYHLKVIETRQGDLTIRLDIDIPTESSLARLYLKLKRYNISLEYANKSLTRSIEENYKEGICEDNKTLAQLYEQMNNPIKALECYKSYLAMRDTLNNDNSKKALQRTEINNLKKKNEQEKIISEKEKKVKEVELKQQKYLSYFFIAGFVLLLLLAIIVLRSYLQKKRANNLLTLQKKEIEEKNEELNQQNEEIRSQRDEIESQKYEIESQRDTVTTQKNQIEHIHKEQTDSIRYAESIQQAVLPSVENMKIFISDYFILFRPKDIVSGDFYWISKRNNFLLIAVADCTGHGVPGAMMSMLGISFLNEIVARTDITEAADVLNELRKSIIKSLNQNGIEREKKDGMDISFIAINFEENLLQYSGANNPLYLIKNKSNELTEIKADRMPIGIYDDMTQFKNHKIEINRGDSLYLFSDGFIDQFGGENRKKFLSKKFKETLLNINNYSMKEQKEKLINVFEEWKGFGEQIDDVTIMGIKI